MSDDTTDFSEEFRTVETRKLAAAEARLEARREVEQVVQLVYARLGRTAAFSMCEFSVKGKTINVVKGRHVIAAISNIGGQDFEVSRPGAGKIAGPISISGVGETIAGLILDDNQPEAA
ncbi:MAG: hypothetical protein ACI89J_003603 [Hyphomicrobiaceae bacterium]|jgi:hypothetical protein